MATDTSIRPIFEPLADNSIMHLHWVDLDSWTVLHLSDTLHSCLGTSADDLRSGDIRYPQLIHPDDREPFLAAVEQFQRQHRSCLNHDPYRLVTATGKTIWVQGHTTRVTQSNGTVNHYFGTLVDISARQHNADIWRQDRERLALALDGAGLGTWDWDIVSGEVIFDRRWAQMLGYRPEDITPHVSSWENLIHPDDQAHVMAQLQEHLDGSNELYRTEHRLRTRAGDWLWVLDCGRVISRDPRGTPLRMSGIHQNINERKVQEDALRRNEANLSTFFDTSTEFLWILDREGRILACNRTVQERLGYSEEELLGRSVLEVHPPERRTEAGRIIQAMLAGAQSSCPVPLLCQNGSQIAVETSVTEGRWNNRPAIFGISKDITLLKLSEEKFAAAFHNSPAIIGLSELETGRYVEVNQSFYDLLGFEPGEVIGRTSTELGILDADARSDLAARLGQQGSLRNLETVIHTRRGTPLDVLLSAELIYVQDRRYNFTTIIDISERKAAERRQRKLEAQVRQKFKMEAVGVMAGGVAHNFNNSLAVILGNIELAQLKLAVPEAVVPLLEDAKSAILRSRDLVQQLLTYSRKGIQERRPMRIDTLLEEARGLLESIMPASMELSVHPLSDSWINADPGRIEEVLLNLCSNAVHAMHEQGTLSLSAERLSLGQEDIPLPADIPAGSFIRLSMADTGHGMSEETLDKIFDPFFTTKAVNEGTGMGLSTVQGIIEQHGGFVTVHSVPDEGTRFELYLPEIPPPAPEQATASVPPRGEERVLFIDDDPALVDLGRMMLEELGYRVTTATESLSALELISDNPQDYDLIITDQAMPEMSGSELVQQVHNIRPELPTILCTGYSQRINRQQAKDLGISAYCMKPLEFTELASTVRNVLD